MSITRIFQDIKKRFDRDLIFTGISQIWTAVTGPLVLLCIPFFLSGEAQGYWYTMMSLAALSTLADLGFTTIVLQFSAHEFAYLRFDETNVIQGDETHLIRIASLFTFCLKWTLVLIVIAFPLILSAGFGVLASQPTQTEWMAPWLLYVIASGIQFFNGILLSFFEGCNSVGNIRKLRFFISLAYTVCILFFLIMHFDLFALAISSLISALAGLLLILKKYSKTIKNLVKIAKNSHYSWKKEFFALLWRFALSFGSGYFIFSIYTPIAFTYIGTIFAGKVGISMMLWSSLFNLSNIWMISITPQLNIHFSKKEWKGADRIFNQNLLYGMATYILGTAAIFFIIVFLNAPFSFIIVRFLGLLPMIFLAIIWFFQIVNNSLATYLRAHKREPLVIQSLLSGIYITILTFLAAFFMPEEYFFVGFLTNALWCALWIYFIFRKAKRDWHND